ncbi:MAG: DNA polymerase III subunit gamma/tau [Calditrichaeota bacterium]|nr:DNA polymerase III subunit gamma/tau [Calditrichota bacterium]
MSYVVIARRWRPQQFDEVIGQEHVSKTLSNAIANQRIAHAYIFSGPRGVGKTTTARILAKAVNCEKGPTPTPCNECASCKAITRGNSLDVLEIDGASNRGIDEIRNLREKIRFAPSMGKYRVYIIDEVHMLTKEAFNALLKTLEEPPEHVIFIFATTEIHRVPATILSRCQRFDFRRMAVRTIMDHLKHICEGDKINVEEEALLQIAKKADGSMRDAQSILDQIISYAGNEVKFEDVVQALGVIHQDFFFKLTELIKDADIKNIILSANQIFETGYDLNEFLLGLEEHFRNILVLKSTGMANLIDTSELYVDRYKSLAEEFSENDLIGYLQVIGETINAVKSSQQPQLKFELGLIKLAKLPQTTQIEQLLEKIDLLKKKADNSLTTSANAVREEPQKTPELSLDYIKDRWSVLVDKIAEKRASLAEVLKKAEFLAFDGKKLSVSFNSEGAIVEGEKSWIERVISSELNHSVRLSVKVEKSAGKKAKKREEIPKEEIMKKIVSKSELLHKLVDEFDLEVI